MAKKCLNALNHIEEIIGCVMVAIMVVILLSQVILRYVFSAPFKQAEEIARYCMIWITFVGASYGAKKRTHAEITFISDRISSKTVRKWHQIIVDLLVTVSFLYLMPEAINFVILQQVVRSPSMLNLPMSSIYIIMPIGIALMCVRYAVHIVNAIRGKEEVKGIEYE